MNWHLKYAKERKAFVTEIINHQAIVSKLADMHVNIIWRQECFCYKAAAEKDAGLDISESGAMENHTLLKLRWILLLKVQSSRWLRLCKRISRRKNDA